MAHRFILIFGFCLAIGACLLADAAAAAPPRSGSASAARPLEGPLERIEMTDGARHEGLIESEDETSGTVAELQRSRHGTLHLVIHPLDRTKIALITRLEPAEHAQLRKRLEQYASRAQIEAGRMEDIALDKAKRDGKTVCRYRGKWFSLESTAEEATARLIVVRLEQVFTAYRQILTPHVAAARPLRLVVLNSTAEYKDRLRQLGIVIENAACFIPEQNLVVAGSELARFSAELEKVKRQHAQMQSELDRLEKDLPDRLAALSREIRARGVSTGATAKAIQTQRRELEGAVQKKRLELFHVDRDNERMLQEVTGRMFARLYHEAFHAYLENYVYPRASHDVPLWLNEGLAEVFESGLLETDSMRIGRRNDDALKTLKADLAGQQPLKLEQVLAAQQQAFLAGGDSSRYYAYAWGLAYYLAFEHQLLENTALDAYVQPAAKNMPPLERFEKLTGTPPDQFSEAWRKYMLRLPAY